MSERILEIGHFAAGFCGRLFVGAGHDVVRIEPAEQLPGWVGTPASDLFLHAGKRRVETRDAALIRDLAAAAQVVIVEAASADALAASGFDDWPTTVKLALTPFGRTGPKRNWRATPHVLLAMGGYTQLIGDPDRAPLSLPGHYLEFQAGHYAYLAATACRLDGRSASIDISLLEVLMSLSQFTTMQWHCQGEIRGRHGNEYGAVCPTNLYRLADGWLYVNVLPHFWDAFTLFLDRPELAIDPRFTSNDLRIAHRGELNALVAAVLRGWSRAEAMQRAEALRIPAGVLLTLDEVLDDPHLAARAFWQTLVGLDGTAVRAPGPPWRFDVEPRAALALQAPEQLDA